MRKKTDDMNLIFDIAGAALILDGKNEGKWQAFIGTSESSQSPWLENHKVVRVSHKSRRLFGWQGAALVYAHLLALRASRFLYYLAYNRVSNIVGVESRAIAKKSNAMWLKYWLLKLSGKV